MGKLVIVAGLPTIDRSLLEGMMGHNPILMVDDLFMNTVTTRTYTMSNRKAKGTHVEVTTDYGIIPEYSRLQLIDELCSKHEYLVLVGNLFFSEFVLESISRNDECDTKIFLVTESVEDFQKHTESSSFEYYKDATISEYLCGEYINNLERNLCKTKHEDVSIEVVHVIDLYDAVAYELADCTKNTLPSMEEIVVQLQNILELSDTGVKELQEAIDVVSGKLSLPKEKSTKQKGKQESKNKTEHVSKNRVQSSSLGDKSVDPLKALYDALGSLITGDSKIIVTDKPQTPDTIFWYLKGIFDTYVLTTKRIEHSGIVEFTPDKTDELSLEEQKMELTKQLNMLYKQRDSGQNVDEQILKLKRQRRQVRKQMKEV